MNMFPQKPTATTFVQEGAKASFSEIQKRTDIIIRHSIIIGTPRFEKPTTALIKSSNAY